MWLLVPVGYPCRVIIKKALEASMIIPVTKGFFSVSSWIELLNAAGILRMDTCVYRSIHFTCT